MEHTKNYIEIRIAKLKTNPITNENIIRKWERKLCKIKGA